MQLINLNTTQTMSSREIAELTGKNHADVLRDIRNMLETLDLGESSFAGTYTDVQGKERPCFNLPYDETICLLTGYDAKARMAVIKRWQELEKVVQEPVAPIRLIDAKQEIEAFKAITTDEELKRLAPLIWQDIVDGAQNMLAATFGAQPQIGNSTKPKDIMQLAKENGLRIPANLKGSAGKYVKKYYSGEPVVTERIINGAVRNSYAYSDHSQVVKLLQEFLAKQ